MGEFLAIAIGLTGSMGLIGLLIGKRQIGGELLVLCGVLILVAGVREGWRRWGRKRG